MESCSPNRRRITIRTSYSRKRLGTCQICCYLPIKRTGANRRAINLIRRITLSLILPKSHWKNPDCCLRCLTTEQRLIRRMSFETKHDFVRINPRKEEIKQPQIISNQNCQSTFKISPTSFGRSCFLVWRANWRISLLTPKLHEPSPRYQEAMVLELLIRKSFTKQRHQGLGRKRIKRQSWPISPLDKSQSQLPCPARQIRRISWQICQRITIWSQLFLLIVYSFENLFIPLHRYIKSPFKLYVIYLSFTRPLLNCIYSFIWITIY